ncbi:hypothetical protein ACI2KS_23765 [Pseudomonas sp. NPDC087358]|uniref:hypothetical protein n=1 Tax=Pseudomonas sp. NPDC087358 TaxID=3364439 RepID=UPI00384C59F2
MRNRGPKFHQWNTSELNPFRHTAILWYGVQVDVQVQLSEGVTLIFIGIYTNTGDRIFEECYGTLHQENESAVDWAMQMAEQAMRAHVNHVG